MKKFEVGKMYELSGTGRYVECIKITECYVFFKENDGNFS